MFVQLPYFRTVEHKQCIKKEEIEDNTLAGRETVYPECSDSDNNEDHSIVKNETSLIDAEIER